MCWIREEYISIYVMVQIVLVRYFCLNIYEWFFFVIFVSLIELYIFGGPGISFNLLLHPLFGFVGRC